ncbi:MAG: C69 family dipeptidase [Candidatus Heimdallarchaeota archaeon]
MCDTFVALAQATADGTMLFAKNSDRPHNEVQNVTHYPRMHHKEPTLRCTYIEIPQVEETFEILLSQPIWMWGAEMGANEYGVVIGNEAVWTRVPDGPPALLGMDLVRLGLERGQTANQASQVIIDLLEQFGQGGACAEGDSSLSYHNSFLIADRKEAWVLETAGCWWVAEKVRKPYRNISNCLSIRSDFDEQADGLIDFALENSIYDGSAPFDFALAFTLGPLDSENPLSRKNSGDRLLKQNRGKIDPQIMMNILRDHSAGICMHGGFRTTASMISHLRGRNEDVHWLTGTPHPCTSLFKPITFPIHSLLPYSPAKASIDNQTLWWRHEIMRKDKLSSFAPIWEKQENSMVSQVEFANRDERKLITTQAFAFEMEKLATLQKT